MRAGTDTALARVVSVFGEARPHHAYLCANFRATRLKVLAHDGFGVWLCARRLHQGKFTGHGHGRRLEAGEVAGRAGWSHGQRRGRLRHRASEARECRPAGSATSMPGAGFRSRLSASRPGTQGRAGTPDSSLARDSSVPGQNRSRMGMCTRKSSNDATFPVPGDSSIEREGEHRECSPPSILLRH